MFISFACHLHELVFYLYVSVCYSYVSRIYSYVTRLWFYHEPCHSEIFPMFEKRESETENEVCVKKDETRKMYEIYSELTIKTRQ